MKIQCYVIQSKFKVPILNNLSVMSCETSYSPHIKEWFICISSVKAFIELSKTYHNILDVSWRYVTCKREICQKVLFIM